MKKLFYGLVAIVMFSFVGNAQNLRSNFLSGKNSHKEVVEAYNNLTDSEQRELWLEKLNQLTSLNLPDQHKALLIKLRNDFADGVDYEKDDFFITASELAKITPAKDFGYMFETFLDYEYSDKFFDSKNLSEEYINNVKDLSPYINLSNSEFARGNCSCRWCLGMGTTGNNCKPTDYGCGFLFLQSCNQCLICL